MKPLHLRPNRNFRAWTLFALGAALALASCSKEEAPAGPQETTTSLNDYFQALPEWEVPSTQTDPPVDLPDEIRTGDGAFYTCAVREFDFKKNFEQLIAVGADATALKPGMLVQGGAMRYGELKVIPLPRSPINISMNLAIDNPSRAIDNPTSANIQTAIAEMQRAADSRLGNLEVIPAQVVFVNEVAHSFEHAMMEADISLEYSNLFKSSGFETSFEEETQITSHSVIVRMYQPMYTISFGDDEKPTPADFFDPSVDVADMELQESLGNVGPDNLPCYVQSVTYGRMLVYTMTSSHASSASELHAAVNAQYGLYSGSGSMTVRQREILDQATVVWKAFGGTQEDAFNAIRNNDFNLFFVPAPATTAIPLSYKVVSMKNRGDAVLGDATKYRAYTCEPRDLRFTVSLDSVQVVFGCEAETSITVNVDINTEDGTRSLINQGNIATHLVRYIRSQISFDMPTTTNSFLHVDAWARSFPDFFDSLWEFDTMFTFPFDYGPEPYRFTQVETASPQARACTLKLFYTIRKELVQ